MEQQPTQTFRRNPFEIIGECFSIYGRHFRKLFLIALVIQIPLAVFGFVLGDMLPSADDLQRLQVSIMGDPRVSLPESAEYSTESPELPQPLTRDEIVGFAIAIASLFVVTLILQTFANGIIVAAVAMQYATGRIDVGACYGRAWWRVISLVILGLLLFGLVVLMIVGFALFIVPGIVIMALIIYWSVDVPAVVIEGCKPISALRRSFELVRDNWWRTFATILLMALTVIGFTIMLTLLLSAPLALLGDDGLSEAMTQVSSAFLGMLTNAIILPIAATVGALIYLDLRARDDDYDIEMLSEELGLEPRSDEYGLNTQ